MRKLSVLQERAINTVSEYSIDFQDSDENPEQLELIADAQIMNKTQAKYFVDIGGLYVYYKESKLVAFYDYEMQRGTIFEQAVA